MIKCPAFGERYGTIAFDGDELIHHGAENSALKNSAPSSLTSFNTSDRTSMWPRSIEFFVPGKNTGRSIKYSRSAVRILNLNRSKRGDQYECNFEGDTTGHGFRATEGTPEGHM